MDQGVIRALKAFYRTNVVRRQIKYIDADRMTPKINILEVMRALVNTATKCLGKASILEETQLQV